MAKNPARPAPPPPSEHELALTLYQAFRRSNDVMFFCDPSGTIVDVNEAFTRHYGWSKDEAVGQNPRLLRSRHTTPELYSEMWRNILNPAVGSWRGEIVNRAKDGRELPMVLTITAVRAASGQIVGYISNALDVSEIRALREKVAHAEALARMGEMAAVVAHEIRNPLGSIVMAARQLAAEGLAEDDRELVLRVLRDESQRLNETLTNFLAYARPRGLNLVRGDLNALVRDVLRIVRDDQRAGGGLKLEADLDEGLEAFRFDADQVRQVVWNLVLNAVQAVDDRGRVVVTTRLQEGAARVTVSDDGPGIPAELRESLFQPFRTSKAQGTGLGLAIAERIARAHGGSVEADLARPRGAAFTLVLPTVQRP